MSMMYIGLVRMGIRNCFVGVKMVMGLRLVSFIMSVLMVFVVNMSVFVAHLLVIVKMNMGLT